jgi:hypothetical protein
MLRVCPSGRSPGPAILWRSPEGVEKEPVVSQRNLIYIVGAIIVVVVVIYFLRT